MAKRIRSDGSNGGFAPRSSSRRSLIVTTAVCAVSLVAFAEGDASDSIQETKEALERWVETRKVISREQRDWALGREILNDRIEIVKREIESVRAKVAEAESNITEVDRNRDELVAENERLKATTAELESMATALETRTFELLARLPDPIRERVRPLSQQIPTGKDGEKVPDVSNRFMNVVGILNEINKFNRDITLTSEVRSLADGTSAEVTALYVGVGQGYYVSGDGKAAGVGFPTKDGWTWRSANEHAAAIASAIAILKNEKVAEFVPLPLSVD